MKILLLQPYLNQRGGGERVILKIAQHYNASIYLLEYSPENTFKEFKDLDIKIVGKKLPFSNLLPYRASQGLRYGYNFYNLKIKEEYDVLNPHISPSEWIRNKNERVLWYCHTPPQRSIRFIQIKNAKSFIQRKTFIFINVCRSTVKIV